jgi:ParB-like chromosome segregation protein Spo0J
MQLRQVDPKELSLILRRLRLVPEVAVRDKVESLRSKGQVSPLVAAEHEGELVLIDGFARQVAAVRLGMQTVAVQVVQLTAVQMKAQLYLRNRERGLQLVDECRLVWELCEGDGLNQAEVAALLERHKSWVCRRLGLWKALSPRLLAQGAVAELGSGSIRRLALLPVCNQEELVAVSHREQLGEHDTALLIDLWRQAPDTEARHYLLEHPRCAIELARAGTQEKLDPRLGRSAGKVHDGLVLMRQAALRVIRQVRTGVEELPESGVKILREACELAERDCPWAIREVLRLLPVTGVGT